MVNCLIGCMLDSRHFYRIFRCALISGQHSEGKVGWEMGGNGVEWVGWEVENTHEYTV